MRKTPILLLLLIVTFTSFGQNGFTKEVDSIVMRNDTLWQPNKNTIVFTGSSSIRFWTDVQKRFPQYHILNTGFGGSQTHDLLYHVDKLVLRYKPKKVFIYEGDNDISSKKKPKHIIETTEKVIAKIQNTLPDTEIVLISAKPSISRWKFRRKYKKLNKYFLKLAMGSSNIYYANVWDIMLNGRKVRKDIFLSDGLHMNRLGYNLWYQQIKPFLP